MTSHAIVVASAGAAAVSAGVNALPLLFTDALVRDLQWSEATLYASISVGMVVSVLTAPLGALLMARFGLRQTIVGVLSILLATLMLSGLAGSADQLAFIWVLAAAASGCLNPIVVGSIVAAKQHPQHCATASSLFLSCSAVAPILALPLFSLLIASFGWFAAISAAAGAIAVTIFGVTVAIPPTASPPRDRGEPRLPFGSFKTWAADRQFWLLVFLTCVCGVTSSGLVGNHLISICRAAGLPAMAGVGAVALTGVTVAFGGLAFGMAADRFSGIWLLAAYYIARALLLFWLPQSSFSFEELSQFAVFYGLDWAATMPALMRLGSQHFGARRIGPCMSILAVVHHGAAAATTFVVGAAGPQFYSLAFGIGGLLCLMAGFLLILNHRCLPTRQSTLLQVQPGPSGEIASARSA
ncbi:MFS transporter [Aminobacter sp. P9b]|uniref:MFS transporter n=1 Tax=Aminobacter sp. P9b TaxID=3133697 RepID=UPI003250794A